MVQTKYGRIEGVDCGSHLEYRGIPYAKAPVGELRWRAPQPPEPFNGTYQATRFPCKAMQKTNAVPPYDKDFYDDPAYLRPVSEDCLYLNIWAPKGASGCPVALWIHGGAFLHGSSSEKEFDGAAYCRRGIVFVSIQYRCNVFGYLAHPWLSAESGVSGNYGALDQLAALRWVYENIAAFGGDPDNITLFGQSAGAMSVQTLVCSPLAVGMVKKAILQSGGGYGLSLLRDIPLQEQEGYGELFAEVLGAHSLAELRARPAEELLAATGPFFERAMPKAGGLFLTPVIDGHLLTGGYQELMDAGKLLDIPYLLGSTKNDILVPPQAAGREESPLHRGCIAFSRKLEELGRAPAYVYYFQRELPGDDLGAWHSSELWYMMGTLDRCWRPWTPEDYALSERMLDYWANFMKTGDPNGGGLPDWRPCAKAEPFVQEFDI